MPPAPSITAVSPAGGPSAPTVAQMPPTGSEAPASPTADKNMFLKLMVTQLRYQNPLEPTDATQFMQQSAQFTMLETLQALQGQQTEATRWARMSTAQGMLGKTVDTVNPLTDEPVSGVVTGMVSTSEGPQLNVLTADGSSVQVFLGEIVGVRDTAATTSATTPTTTPATQPPASPPDSGSAGTDTPTTP